MQKLRHTDTGPLWSAMGPQAPLASVCGGTKIFVNDPLLVGVTLGQLGLAKEGYDGLAALASAAGRVQQAASEVFGRPFTGLREVAFVLWKQSSASSKVVRQVEHLNAAYSFLRHTTVMTCDQLVQSVRQVQAMARACPASRPEADERFLERLSEGPRLVTTAAGDQASGGV